ncbi:MAG TPA: glycine--tRNA ligase subunit beta [Terriglobia bacterium]|nr:glycine--tRNA ligase subunit beta [Terriglobia bacterium]
MAEPKGKEFLLEIGVEEVPAWMIPSALEGLKQLLTEGLVKLGFAPESLAPFQMYATPRRLVAFSASLPSRQPTTEELIEGPPRRIAIDASGKPAMPAIKFAEKMGIPPEKLITVATAKGEYVAFKKIRQGRPTAELLKELVPQAVLGIYWPRAMYWEGKGGPHFIRPIRWLLVLYGGKTIPCAIGSVQAGKWTWGHRQLGKAKLAVKDFASYRQTLRDHFVILEPAERRVRIQELSDSLLRAEEGLRSKQDPGLLETHTYLTEYPTPLLGSFDPSYLALPEEVLTTVMRGHQKYFAVEDAQGRLAPRFLAIMETDADRKGLIRHGHERVLRARFNDARFFWESDGRTTLADRLEWLRTVTFQAKLGSYFDKTARMQELAEQLIGAIREGGGAVSPEEAAQIVRAARLSKSDLTTDLVKEFTELQGIIGGLLARREGLPEEIATAIYDHYLPQSMEDALPRSLGGQIVSLADRMDTLAGCFGVGLAPTGSKDPLGLRRAAQGVIRILAENKLPLTLETLVAKSCEVYTVAQRLGEAPEWSEAAARTPLGEFLVDRLRYYLREVRGFAYDEVNAVLAAGRNDVADAVRRLEALAQIRPTENFEPLAAAFKRMKNILQQARESYGYAEGELHPEWFQPGPELALYERYLAVYQEAERAKQSGNILAALQAIASLRPAVDLFFDKILVMDKDARLRNNRLGLLATLLRQFSTIADFAEIVPREPTSAATG